MTARTLRAAVAVVALLGATTVTAHAQDTFTFDFDTATAGDLAQSLFPAGLLVNPATFNGTIYEADTSAPAITVFDDPDFDAPSGQNMLGDGLSPILISTEVPTYNTILNISFTTDLDPFGDAAAEVLAQTTTGVMALGSTIDQTAAGQTYSYNFVINDRIRGIVLPSGGFYDNLSITVSSVATPEPGTIGLILLGAGPLALGIVRRKRA